MTLKDLKIRHVTIVGAGLLGSSLGLALKRLDRSVRITGVGRRQASLDEALAVGALDTAHLDIAQCAAASDLIVLATPVGVFGQYLQAMRPLLKRGAVVTDVGSTKAVVVRLAERVLGKGGPFVGSHPMAGSERKGPAFARADLFESATCIMTPTPASPPSTVRRVERLWKMLGMRVVKMSPSGHDRAVARISHLPHLLSALTMLLPGSEDLKLSAGGFRDVTRLAGGDAEMWRDILLTNARQILAAIDDFDEDLMMLRDLIEVGDAEGIERFLTRAKDRRQKLFLGRNPAGGE